ncbi:hypothetical protein OTU49_005173 [Cherax quadricarinatus]|uniref:Uncharacterized protein n=1 Tax=Cherax quadricarinatus TaxID=27406 RepID=A0AAW0YLN2_CHEQU
MLGCCLSLWSLVVAFIILQREYHVSGSSNDCARWWWKWRDRERWQCPTEKLHWSACLLEPHMTHCLTHATYLPTPLLLFSSEMIVKDHVEEYAHLITGDFSGKQSSGGIEADNTSYNGQLSSAPSLVKKIHLTSINKLPQILFDYITPQLFLPSTSVHVASLSNKNLELVGPGKFHHYQSNSPAAKRQEGIQTTCLYSCHCTKSYFPKTLETDRLHISNYSSTNYFSKKRTQFLKKSSSPLLEIKMETSILFTSSQSKKMKLLMSSFADFPCKVISKTHTSNKESILGRQSNEIFCTDTLHQIIEVESKTKENNMEKNILSYIKGKQKALNIKLINIFRNKTNLDQKIKPFPKNFHFNNIVYATPPINMEVLEFKTVNLKVSIDSVLNTKHNRDEHCSTCGTAGNLISSGEQLEIFTTYTSLDFPEPFTRSISLHCLLGEKCIKKLTDYFLSTNEAKVSVASTNPPDVIPEPRTKFSGANRFKYNTLENELFISLYIDHNSVWATHQILSSASPSHFPEPKTYFPKVDAQLYDTKAPESVTLESSLRSFPDATLSNTEIHAPMTTSWQHLTCI